MLGKISFNKHFEDISDYGRIISRFICHRIPERTFQIKGTYFPVCSRCTGLYTGAILYYIYALFNFINYSQTVIIISFVCILPLLTDGISQFLGLRESNNILRFITGLMAGISVFLILAFIKIIIT